MAFTQVSITGTYADAEGNPAQGTVTFTPNKQMRNGVSVAPGKVTVSLVNGAIPAGVDLAATDDPGTTPSGAVYKVTEQIEGTLTTYLLPVYSAAGTIDLGTAVRAESAPAIVTYQVLSAKGQANGYAPLDGTGKVPSANLPASVGGGVTDHGALTGLADDDHTQYLTTTRGDARYPLASAVTTALAGKAATVHTHSADDVSDGTTNKAYTATEKTKLAGIASGATVNSADATLLARANHTGTQSADTLTDGTTNKAFLANERTKLTGIATSATANSADATLLARANHTGTQSADTLTDGTTNKAFLATERTKLTGIATSATANSADATLLARANHTGTQAATTITGLATVATSGLASDLSGTLAVARLPIVLMTIQAATVAGAATHITAAGSGSYVDLTLTGTTAAIAVPTGGVNRQTIEYAMRNTNGASCTVTFNSSIRLSTGFSTRDFVIPTGEFLFASLKYSTLNAGTIWTLVAGTVSAT